MMVGGVGSCVWIWHRKGKESVGIEGVGIWKFWKGKGRGCEQDWILRSLEGECSSNWDVGTAYVPARSSLQIPFLCGRTYPGQVGSITLDIDIKYIHLLLMLIQK